MTSPPYVLFYYSNLLSPLRSLKLLMGLIVLIPVALATSALLRIAFGRDLGDKARRDSDSDPQTSLSKCNESSLSPFTALTSSIYHWTNG